MPWDRTTIAAAWARVLRVAGTVPPWVTLWGPGVRPDPLMGTWQATASDPPGVGVLREDRGACRRQIDACPGLSTWMRWCREAGSVRRGWCRVTRTVDRGLILMMRSGPRRQPPLQRGLRDTPGRVRESRLRCRYGWSWPEPPAGWTPHADGSRRAPARTGALRAAGVTNGCSDGGASGPFH